ncbi:MAG: hypothetical protein II453_05695 [Alphaproteobacteria bacterium]|nr:hypothetical protein [Alphaproteobacteria bacterium]
MNKILQLSLVSALVATNAFVNDASATVINGDFQQGYNIDGTAVLPDGYNIQAGMNNGIDPDTKIYNESNSTAINVMSGGKLVANENNDRETANVDAGGKILSGLLVRHHDTNWKSVTKDQKNYYYINDNSSGFISNNIQVDSPSAELQEIYHTSGLNTIFNSTTGNTYLLSTAANSPKGDGELALSENNCFYPSAIITHNSNTGDDTTTNLIVPNSTFIIPSLTADNCTIAANLSTDKETIKSNLTAAGELQLLPASDKTLSLTGANQFAGKIIIGDGSEGNSGTVAFGKSNGTNTIDALGTYTEMVVNDNATVRLAGDDPVSINKNWTFHGAAKLIASQRVTIASGAKMIFGAD